MIPIILFPIINILCFAYISDKNNKLKQEIEQMKEYYKKEVKIALREEMNMLSSSDYINLKKYTTDNKKMYY